MAESVVYGSVTGSIFASLPALNTRVVAFDTAVVDLTEQCGNDPVDMIFGVQLGGGTDINKAVAYCEKFIPDPAQTIFFLISDLIEGGNQAQLDSPHEGYGGIWRARHLPAALSPTAASRPLTSPSPKSSPNLASPASAAHPTSCRNSSKACLKSTT